MTGSLVAERTAATRSKPPGPASAPASATAAVAGSPGRRGFPDPRRYPATARRRRFRAGALEMVGCVSMAASVALFLADGGAYQFGTIADAFTSVGIVAGLLATNALLLMLLLAARVPFVDRTLGLPRATELHKLMGQWVVFGLGVHAAFVLAGYALADQASLVAEFTDLWGGSADFGLAVAGMALLLVVASSSIVAARRRLPYEVWHVIHLVAYVAVGCSIPHMFTMGSLFSSAGPQQWYWAGLLIVTGAALLIFRFILPAVSTFDHRLRVSRVEWISQDAVNIEMTGRNVGDLEVAGGQYLHWRFLAPGLWWHQHPFSVSARPTADTLRITVRALGRGTAALTRVRPGTMVAIEGPYGIFCDAARTTDAVVMVGAGVGIAPIRALLEETAIMPGRATVILRASRPEEICLLDEITGLCRARGAALVTMVGHRAPGRWTDAAHPDVTLRDVAPFLPNADVFVCGPDGLTGAVVDEARALGVPRDQIHDERFTW